MDVLFNWENKAPIGANLKKGITCIKAIIFRSNLNFVLFGMANWDDLSSIEKLKNENLEKKVFVFRVVKQFIFFGQVVLNMKPRGAGY